MPIEKPRYVVEPSAMGPAHDAIESGSRIESVVKEILRHMLPSFRGPMPPSSKSGHT